MSLFLKPENTGFMNNLLKPEDTEHVKFIKPELTGTKSWGRMPSNNKPQSLEKKTTVNSDGIGSNMKIYK